MPGIMSMLAAGLALQTVGMYNNYKLQKDLAGIQQENYELQQLELELEKNIKIRTERAEQRAQQAQILVTNTAHNTQRSSLTRSQIQASQSFTEGNIQNITQLTNLAQQSLGNQIAASELQEPSVLDLALGIGGAAVDTFTTYNLYQKATNPSNYGLTNLNVQPVTDLNINTNTTTNSLKLKGNWTLK